MTNVARPVFKTPAREGAEKFADRMVKLGFVVYMAESGSYGFVTDEYRTRVLYFQFEGLGSSLSGKYGPPSRESGTGWAMSVTPEQLRTAEQVRSALYSTVSIRMSGGGWRYYTTVDQYLAMYGKSSKYRRWGE